MKIDHQRDGKRIAHTRNERNFTLSVFLRRRQVELDERGKRRRSVVKTVGHAGKDEGMKLVDGVRVRRSCEVRGAR